MVNGGAVLYRLSSRRGPSAAGAPAASPALWASALLVRDCFLVVSNSSIDSPMAWPMRVNQMALPR